MAGSRHFDARCLKTLGLGTENAPRLLHFELPRSARDPTMHEASATLIARLVNAVTGSR